MLTTLLAQHPMGDALALQFSVIAILLITILFFLVLLVIGVRNSIRLKAENDRLSEPKISSEEDNKVYRDFREGHLYDNY